MSKIFGGLLITNFNVERDICTLMDLGGYKRTFSARHLDNLDPTTLRSGMLVDFEVANFKVTRVGAYSQPLDGEDATRLRDKFDADQWEQAKGGMKKSGLMKYRREFNPTQERV